MPTINQRAAVAADPSTAEATLRELAVDKSPKVRSAVAGNPASPPDVLDSLANDQAWQSRFAVASNRSPRAIKSATNSRYSDVRGLASQRDDLDDATRHRLLNDPDHPVRISMAEGCSDPETLIALSRDERDDVRAAVVFNCHLPVAVVELLADDPRAGVRAAVAASRRVRPDTLTGLASDRSAVVRWRVIFDNAERQDHGPARLVLTETKTRVGARVEVEQKRLPPGVVCSTVGIPRTVRARLAEPIGDRKVWAAGRQYVPFDGARLLEPAKLPPGFTGSAETSSSVKSSTAAESVVTTTTWVTGHFEPESTSNVNTCPATRGELDVQIGPVAADHPVDWTKVGTVKIATAQADLYRQGTSNKPDGWAYLWTTDHSSVEVGNFARCQSDRLLSRTELLRVAKSLRPA